jgi:hypothetical protein
VAHAVPLLTTSQRVFKLGFPEICS